MNSLYYLLIKTLIVDFKENLSTKYVITQSHSQLGFLFFLILQQKLCILSKTGQNKICRSFQNE